jgi:WD40 repeat protein
VPGFTDSEEGASAAAFSADDKYLFVGTIWGNLQVWDLAQRRCIQTEKAHNYFVSAVATSSEGATFMTSGDQTLAAWDAASRKLLSRWRGHTGHLNGLDTSSDGKLVYSAGEDGTRVWSAEKNIRVGRLPGCSRVVGFSPDSQTVIAQIESGLRLWNTGTGSTNDLNCPGLGFFHDYIKPAGNIAVHPREPVAALGMTNGTVEIWNVASRQREKSWPAHTEAIRVVAFARDGAQLATASTANEVAVWNVSRAERVHRFGSLSVAPTCLVFSADGRQLLASGESKTIWVFDLVQGQELAPLLSPGGSAANLALSPNGTLLAAEAEESTSVNLLDFPSGKVRAVLSGPVQLVVAMDFSADGRTLATGIDTRDVILWNLNTAQPMLRLPCEDAFDSLCFSPDGRSLAVGSSHKYTDREIRLYFAPAMSEIESRN